jgi:hypothetical protein
MCLCARVSGMCLYARVSVMCLCARVGACSNKSRERSSFLPPNLNKSRNRIDPTHTHAARIRTYT